MRWGRAKCSHRIVQVLSVYFNESHILFGCTKKTIPSVCRCCFILFLKELKFGICALHRVWISISTTLQSLSVESVKVGRWYGICCINEILNGTWSSNSIGNRKYRFFTNASNNWNRTKEEKKGDLTISIFYYYLDLNAFMSYKFYGRHSVSPENLSGTTETNKLANSHSHSHLYNMMYTHTQCRDISRMLDTLRFYLKL